MTSRTVTATITDPTGQPREGLAVFFHAPDGFANVVASTDASGVVRADLETGQLYRVSVENAVIVDGLPFPAGTVFRVNVPEGEGPATAPEALVGTDDASRPALLDAIAALQAAHDALTARVDALEAPETPEEP